MNNQICISKKNFNKLIKLSFKNCQKNDETMNTSKCSDGFTNYPPCDQIIEMTDLFKSNPFTDPSYSDPLPPPIFADPNSANEYFIVLPGPNVTLSISSIEWGNNYTNSFANTSTSEMGEAVVVINLDDKGKEVFCNVTQANIGNPMAIFVGGN